MTDSNSEFPTTIGSDATFKGQLKFEKGVRLLGSFEGEIDTKGQLHIAEGAHFTGEVQAGSVKVDGEVKGNLNANAKVQLTASGHLEGDIHASRLEVAEGATLVGHCVVGANGKSAPAVPKAPTPQPQQNPPGKDK